MPTSRDMALEIIQALDNFARNHDAYEYGLPVHGSKMDDMVDIVVKFLTTFLTPAP